MTQMLNQIIVSNTYIMARLDQSTASIKADISHTNDAIIKSNILSNW